MVTSMAHRDSDSSVPSNQPLRRGEDPDPGHLGCPTCGCYPCLPGCGGDPEPPGQPDEPSNADLDALAASRPTREERDLLRDWLRKRPYRFRDEAWTPGTELHREDELAERGARGRYGSGRLYVDQDDLAESREAEPVSVEHEVVLRNDAGRKRTAHHSVWYGGETKVSSRVARRMRQAFDHRFGLEVHRGPRPGTRGSCAAGCRPCPFVSCQYSLYLDVTSAGGIRLPRPSLDPHEVEPEWSCALDVAERGPHTLDGVSRLLGVTRERVRQILDEALRKIRRVEPDLAGGTLDEVG